MARIRTIKPKFWDDQKIGKLSRDARLLYIGLWTFSDDLGVVIADSVWLKSKIFPYDQIQMQQFDKWKTELVRNGFICLFSYNEEEFIYLPKFTRHQVINRPNIDDLNVPKDFIDNNLDKITNQSLINHGTITDQSLTIIGEEKDKEYIIPSSLRSDGKSDSKSNAPDLHIENTNEFLKFFNSELDSSDAIIPRIRSIDGMRKSFLNARLREYGSDAIKECVRKAAKSDFLNGKNKKCWVADFTWIFRPNNFPKVLEGNYDNRIITNQSYANNLGHRDKRRRTESSATKAEDYEGAF